VRCDRTCCAFAGSKLGNGVGRLIGPQARMVARHSKDARFLRRKNKPKHFPNQNKFT
jgi:hypothetical protein